ncbi:SAM-dependent methyltransferase [Amycolatopsis sp. GM8]|uniref:SAM-dependent methyltransferase n=1 Tax=Amycolatopsis sp. GM8 TaxID=2896530 RepID=UPI001F486055|nr:SAM-dependent methyltransferase [Amycolatopsis sp. GM8]
MTLERATGPFPGLDLEHPSAARVYDFLLGGTTNWAIDRGFAKRAIEKMPIVRVLAKTNREFIQRAAVFCAQRGFKQFLDLGSGIPTAGNVHEIVDTICPDARVVYVDFEPVAVAHSRLLLEEHGDPERHTVIHENLLDARAVWETAVSTGVLDPGKPLAVLAGAVLHFVLKPDVHDALQSYRELMVPGSALALTHVVEEGVPEPELSQIREFIELYQKSSTPVTFRTRDEIRSFYGDFAFESCGLAWLPEWLPDIYESPAIATLHGNPARSCVVGGLALKPEPAGLED